LNYAASYIPRGCSRFVQVLDVSFEKPLKAFVAQAVANYANKSYKRYTAGDLIVMDQRVLLTK
jgi:hypothetical protein